MELTLGEKKVIAAMGDVTEMWGAENEADFIEMFDNGCIYAVKFNYQSGCPGYVGNLFVLFGDAGWSESVKIIRRDGKMVLSQD
jgi:hypothetical protein